MKYQLLQVLGKTDGICRKMLRDCLMKLKGYSLIFQKVWRSGKASNLTKTNTTPVFKKTKNFLGTPHRLIALFSWENHGENPL